MAAKGTESKELVLKKLQEIFPNAFFYDKEFRIPFMENGEEVQIKCALTCAKINVDHDSTVKVEPVAQTASIASNSEFNFDSGFPSPKPKEVTQKIVEMTEAEKDNVATMLARLGF